MIKPKTIIKDKPIATLTIHGAAEMTETEARRLREWLIGEAFGIAQFRHEYARTYRARLYKEEK